MPVALNLPFQALGKRIVSEDFVLSFDPVLETALLVTILFLWLRKLTTVGLAFFLTMAAAFGTMLWPYAYIGLETKQSLFLLLAGYLTLARAPIQSFTDALVFGLCCAFAVGAKANSFMLAPAVAYLCYLQFREQWRARLPFAVTTVVAAGILVLGGAAAKSLYWAPLGVTPLAQFRSLMNDSAFQYLGAMIGLFGSPNKGLLLYAPLLVVSLWAVPAAWRSHRRETMFVLLSVAGLVLGMSSVRHFADEVWGPRYLHSCVCPLVLLIGASRNRFSWRRDGAMLPLAALGVVVSFLGAFYYYGNLHFASMRVGENSRAELLGDTSWNQVSFNERLLATWWRSAPGPVLWTPIQDWMWTPPPGAPAPGAIDLKAWSEPQPMLIRGWRMPHRGFAGVVWYSLLLCLFVGPFLLLCAGTGLVLGPLSLDKRRQFGAAWHQFGGAFRQLAAALRPQN